MKRGRPRAANRKELLDKTVVHVALNVDLHVHLVEMAFADRRKMSDFVRLLIEREWDRRKSVIPGNSDAAVLAVADEAVR